MDWWYGGGTGWVMMMGMGVFWLLVLAVVAWSVARAFPRSPRGGDDARAILDRRLAAGEIDLDAYRAMLHELTATRRS